MAKGLLIIMSGPSGVGKGTIRQKLVAEGGVDLYYSISLTTRKMRPGEQDGVEYYFVSKEAFEENLRKGNLLESNSFCGNSYGTPKDKVYEKLEEGKNVLLEIDVNGAKQVLDKTKDIDPLSIFIMPPSIEALEERIRNRHTENEDAIVARLSRAKGEISAKDSYKCIVVNDDLDKATAKVRDLILQEISKKR